MENIMHWIKMKKEKLLKKKQLIKVGQKIISEHSRLMDEHSVSISKHLSFHSMRNNAGRIIFDATNQNLSITDLTKCKKRQDLTKV